MPSWSVQISNGLQIISHALPASPLLAVRVYVLAGSAYEPEHQHGSAHLLEHLVLRRRTPTPPVVHELFACGTTVHGWTTRETTTYSVVAQRAEAETMLQALREVLFQFQVEQAAFAQEQRTIQQEHQQRHVQLAWRLQEQLFAHLWSGTSYAHAILGEPAAVAALNRADIEQFYEIWYQPGNLMIVLAGDDEAFGYAHQAARLFSMIPPRSVPEPPPAVVPAPQPALACLDLPNGTFAAGAAFPEQPKNTQDYVLTGLTSQIVQSVTGFQIKQVRIREGGALYCTCTGRNMTADHGLERMFTVLDSAITTLLSDDLERLIKQAMILHLRNSERIENRIAVLAEHWIYDRSLFDQEAWLDFYAQIQPPQIRRVLKVFLADCKQALARHAAAHT